MPDEIKQLLEDQAKAAETARAKHTEELKQHAGRISDLDEKLKASGEANVELKTAFQDSTERLARAEENVKEASDKLAKLSAPGRNEQKSIGDLLGADEMKQTLDNLKIGGGKGQLLKFDTKAITTTSTGMTGVLIQPERDLSPIMALQQRLWLRQLIPAVPTTSGAIEWVQELSRTNNAGIQVNEGDEKPESTIDFEMKNSSCVTIAHWTHASRQVLDDLPQLQGLIEDMLRTGLNQVEETQLLLGAGTGGNMLGIMPQATDYNAGAVMANEETDATNVDRIRWAMVAATDALHPASGIAMNHIDWAKIELSKTDDKAYLFANPVNATQPRLWGLPVIDSPSMTAGTFLTGGFATGAMIYDREQTVVRIADMDQNDFVTNMIKVLVEKRVMIAVKRPASFQKGVFK